MDYKSRCIEKTIEDNLDAFGGLLITGPKWCGKTTTAKRFSKSIVEFANPKERVRMTEVADIDISMILKGEKPRLFDEWQVLPDLWDAIRYDVDESGMSGQYILTGSLAVDRKKILHSGAGRIVSVKMSTMSLYESGDSSGEVSLSDLFDGNMDVSGESKHEISDVAGLIARGGWPGVLGKKDSAVRSLIQGYCETLLEQDISSVDGVNRDPERMRAVLRSLARNESTEAENTLILEDVISGGNRSMHINTLTDYLRTLDSLFVTNNLRAWSPHLKSKTAIRTSDVRHLADPSIGVYFLGASSDDLLNDPKTFGLYFESLVIRDLRVYAKVCNGEVYHYRDKDGLEADAVIHLNNGKWAALEVKLGRSGIDSGAEHLLKLSNKVDDSVESKPSFLAVVTPTGLAYRRSDGVFVIPIGCLKP